ncbi:UNVERIFIED_CONTAM: Upstream activation factor subunit UAF30 [Sesamum latifolium]|uniref:Upstream activation factor subunit UAF30 n=1 Tax=Sesamum latifolium TaxID=2727402 RepID=A0AAW2WPG6_9LAMI
MSERAGAAAPPAGLVVTEQQIAEALEALLRDTNAFTSFNGVVQQLESKLGVNLSTESTSFAPRSSISSASRPSTRISSEGYSFHQPPPSQPQLSQPPPTPPVAVKNPSVTTASVSAKESVPTTKKRRGGPGGLNKLCGVSPELQTIVGQPALPRTEIVKQLWAYIRKNNLQDPNNKRKIICNDELRLVFETDCTDMFKMNKLLAKHILPLEPTKQTAENAKRPKVDVVKADVPGSDSKSDDPVPIVLISEALASFFGTEEREMSQAEVLRQMWEYIKVNQLEDPMNPAAIICDAKLQELLGCESISALGIPEMLARRHLYKKS